MNKFFKSLKQFFLIKSAEERYLDKSMDIFDLERRQREITSPWRRSIYY
jgi:hypothetical protein